MVLNTRVRIALLLSLVAALVVAGVTFSPAQADTQEAVEDAHVLKKNGGGANEGSLAVRGPGSNETWAIMKFTAPPAGAATVTINTLIARSGTFSLVATTCGWSENTVTWNNKPAAGSVLDTEIQAVGAQTFDAGTLPGGVDVCFYLQSSNGQSQASQVAASEHTSQAGPTLNTGPAPTTTTAAPTTTTSAPTTTTVAPTTTTTTPPDPNCLLTSNYATDQAAIDDAGGPDGDPMCVTVDTYRTISGPISLRTGVTVQCVDGTKGFTSTSSWALVVASGISDATLQGCKLESSGPTTSASAGIDVSGTLARVRFADLNIRNVEYGIAGSPTVAGTGWTDQTFGLRVLNVDIYRTYATGIGLYGGQTRYVEIGGSEIIGNQRSGLAGQAGIQTGGNNSNLHSFWHIHHSVVNNSTAAVGLGCTGSDLVDIGLDQISNSELDNNVITHCPGSGEGFVVNGPNNWIHHNQVHDKGGSGGAYVLISYSSSGQANVNNVFEDNLADGVAGSGGNQGLAISWGPSGQPVIGLVVRRFTAVNHQLGIQSYPFQGTPAGSNNQVVDSNPGGAGPNPWCSGLSPLNVTVTNTPNCSASS